MERRDRRDRDKEKKGRPMRRKKRRVCVFCADKSKVMDYLDISFVRKFVSDRGKILPPRTTGCCALHQRVVAKAIKRAREAGLVPYTLD
ncbi:MAG: 30S ribosomal protein S18 [Candidatus Margulisbacteria bacterium]|nr:30S ribosomal protein S18 [Candidatus Margulisiibacteriota bacterium]